MSDVFESSSTIRCSSPEFIFSGIPCKETSSLGICWEKIYSIKFREFLKLVHDICTVILPYLVNNKFQTAMGWLYMEFIAPTLFRPSFYPAWYKVLIPLYYTIQGPLDSHNTQHPLLMGYHLQMGLHDEFRYL